MISSTAYRAPAAVVLGPVRRSSSATSAAIVSSPRYTGTTTDTECTGLDPLRSGAGAPARTTVPGLDRGAEGSGIADTFGVSEELSQQCDRTRGGLGKSVA